MAPLKLPTVHPFPHFVPEGQVHDLLNSIVETTGYRIRRYTTSGSSIKRIKKGVDIIALETQITGTIKNIRRVGIEFTVYSDMPSIYTGLELHFGPYVSQKEYQEKMRMVRNVSGVINEYIRKNYR